MEAFGKAPYYGWDSNFFDKFPKYLPIGSTHIFEGEGLSKMGGNTQIKDKPKEFIVFPSVLAAMEYKAYYIKKFDGNYARWHSTDKKVQEVYKKSLLGVIPRIINQLEESNDEKTK